MEQRGKSNAVAKTVSHSATPSRGRVSSKAAESPKPLVSVSAAQSTPQSVKNRSSKVSRSLIMNASKSRDDAAGSKKVRDTERVGAPARTGDRKRFPQRFASGAGSCTNSSESDRMKSELQEKLCSAEDLIRDLQSQLLVSKEELQKSQSLNLDLQSRNERLARDLASAESQLENAQNNDQRKSTEDCQQPNVKATQNLEPANLEATTESPPQSSKFKAPTTKPPPPPPLPLRSLSRTVATQKSPDLVRLFHSIRKKEEKREPPLLGKSAVISAHNSIVGEIQNRSAHLLAIRSDIETKGEFVNGLIGKVLATDYTDIEDVLKFVDWLDSQLSSLADERAVLKHFKWPERKADAMREAAIEYHALKLLENEISSFKDDTNTPCEASLKKMASLLDKSERGIQRLMRLRNTAMHSYQDLKLPTNWMLDSGIMTKIKQGSMNLAKMYMKRVETELDSIRSSDRESGQESLLLQGLHFAYRTHQFAGGLDSETLCAFEEIQKRVPTQVMVMGDSHSHSHSHSHSRAWVAGIPSS